MPKLRKTQWWALLRIQYLSGPNHRHTHKMPTPSSISYFKHSTVIQSVFAYHPKSNVAGLKVVRGVDANLGVIADLVVYRGITITNISAEDGIQRELIKQSVNIINPSLPSFNKATPFYKENFPCPKEKLGPIQASRQAENHCCLAKCLRVSFGSVEWD